MSTLNDFGIPGVAEGILHPKQRHRWRVFFIGMAGGTGTIPLSHQLVTFTRPSLNFEKIQLDRFNSRAFVAGKHVLEPLDFTLEDDITGTASRILQQQLQYQQWITGAQGPFLGAAAEGSQYKFACRLEMLDGGRGQDPVSGGDPEVAERITLEGCFLETVNYGDLDYSSSEAVQITVTLSYDHWRQDLGGYSGPGSALGGHA